jgi:hypothetical protein
MPNSSRKSPIFASLIQDVHCPLVGRFGVCAPEENATADAVFPLSYARIAGTKGRIPVGVSQRGTVLAQSFVLDAH